MVTSCDPGLSFGASSACTVRILQADRLQAEEPFESALVFSLPDDITRFVLELRQKNPRPAPPEDQLVPHITILYLGVTRGPLLHAIQMELKSHLPAMTATATLAGFGVFNPASRGQNWHLTVTPQAPLAALKQRLERLCGACGWQATGSRHPFTPHITIWDDFEGSVPDGSLSLIPRRSFELNRMLHIGRQRAGAAYV